MPEDSNKSGGDCLGKVEKRVNIKMDNIKVVWNEMPYRYVLIFIIDDCYMFTIDNIYAVSN